MFQCNHITKQKGCFTLSDICFELEPGYILGVIGRNGAGKTTLVRTLLGSYRLADSCGNAYLSGISLHEETEKYKNKVAFVLNESPFDMNMNARDNGLLYGRYYSAFQMERYEMWLEEFQVPEKMALKRLSKGQKIKQQLAFALSYDARLYILDEPTENLDVEFRNVFHKQIRNLIADGDKSVIYVSHLVDEVEQLADFILWLGVRQNKNGDKYGVQNFFGSMEELREQYQLVETDQEKADIPKDWIVGTRIRKSHQEMLVHAKRTELPEKLWNVSRNATLKEMMYYVEQNKEEGYD